MCAYKLITVLNPLQQPQKINYTQFLFAKQIFFSLSLFYFSSSFGCLFFLEICMYVLGFIVIRKSQILLLHIWAAVFLFLQKTLIADGLGLRPINRYRPMGEMAF